PSEDNRAVRFLSEEEIYQRLSNNQHGRVLDLSGTSFETPKSIRLLEGIAATQSIYEVNLSNCRFTAPAFKALCEALRLNESVRQVYLTDAVLPQGALEGLGEALKYNMTLDHLLLPLDHPFTAEEISIFYDHIHFNTALAFIGWPQKVLKEVEKQAQTHPTALVHLGFLYSSPLMTMSKPAKDHKTMEYFKKADKLKHPLGAYGLAKIYQKQENYTEALKFYERAADADHAHSQMILSTYYRALWPQKSPLLSEPDYLQAFNWARQAAHLGFPEALYRVGRMYEAGRYVQHSLTKAGAYFHDAIQKGHPEAFTALGMLYNNPDYAYYDPEKAMSYLELAKRYTHLFSTATRLLKNIEDH
ncbi:MAG: SEL1-like repeat protein, partial [Candidatus Paracaedibacteraceae bacterium]|nr:SEL1-like repeat protein [Candidatus Paracaedibacteraceae bacterium]